MEKIKHQTVCLMVNAALGGLFVSYFAIRTTVDFEQLNHHCDDLVAEWSSFAIAVC